MVKEAKGGLIGDELFILKAVSSDIYIVAK